MATSSRRRTDQGTDSTSTQAASTTASVTRRSRRPGVIAPVPHKKRWRHWLYAATLLVAGSAGSAQAETFTVTNNNDSGAGSLRQAMLDAAANADASNTINFAASLSGGDTITLAGALPNIGKNLTIDGAANSSLAISGDGQFRPFFVDTGTVSIKSLTIQNGTAQGGNGGSGYAGGGGGLGAGGAIFVNSGAAVTVQGVAFASNTARGGNGGIRDTGLGAAGGGGGSIFGTNGGNSSSSNDGGNGAGPTGGAGGATGGNNGGDGGFGSGGGGGGFFFGTPPDKGGDGGDGGFGGGGGGAGGLVGSATNNTAIGGTGGFGAGNGGSPSGAGGGGSAYGGAIFVRSGGSLTIVDSGISGGSTVAGTGSTAGAAAGTGLFLNDATVNYTVTNGNTLTLSDTISGTGGLIKDGDGKLTLFGANDYSGDTQLNAGTLSLYGVSGTIGTGTLIANGGSLEVDRNFGSGLANDIGLQQNLTVNQVQDFNLALSGDISESGGSYGLNTSGAGIIILEGNNSFTGDVNIGNRSLYISSNTALAQGNNVNIASGSELVTTGSDAIIGELTGPGRIYFLGGSVTAGNANDFTYDGGLEGFGNFVKDGTGTMTLGKEGAVFQNDGLVTISDGAISGNATQFNDHNIANNAELILEQTTDGSYSGVISGSGDVVKNGAGKLTISGANTYAGDTTLNAGVIALDGATADIGTGSLIAEGGSLEFVSGNNNFSNNIVLNQDLTIVAEPAGFTSINGEISGTGDLTFNGAGTIYLSGSNSFTGDLNIDLGGSNFLFVQGANSLVNGNNVNVASGSGMGAEANAIVGDLTGGGYVALYNSTLTAGSTNDFEFDGVVRGTGSFIKDGSGDMKLNYGSSVFQDTVSVTISGGSLTGNATQFSESDILNNATLIFDQASDGTYGKVISGSGVVVKEGTGVLTITGNNTYTGNTELNEGTLELSGSSARIGTGSLVANGGTLRFADGQSLNNDIVLDSDLTIQQIGSQPGGSNTFLYGNLFGSKKLTVEKSSGDYGVSLWLVGNNVHFTGDLQINDGWVTAFSANALTQQNNVHIADEAALAVWMNGAAIVGDVTGAGDVFLASGSQITVGTSNDAIFDGRFTGSGNFIKTGSGSLTLTGSNAWGGHALVHTGTTTISDGSLIGSAAAFYNQNITNNATVVFDQTTDGTYSGVMSGSGELVKEGTGRLILEGANTYSGGTTVTAGVLEGTANSLQGDILNNAEVDFNQSTDSTYSGVITGTGELTKSGIGTLSITGANAYEGDTNLNDGILAIGTGGSLGTGTIQANGGWLQFNDSNQSLSNDIALNEDLTVNQLQFSNSTLSGDLSGDGKLTANGAGALWLSGDNSGFTGDVDIQNFMLILLNDNALSQGNNVHIASGSQLATYSASHAIIGDLTGSGNINLNYAGKVTAGTSNNVTFDGQITNTGTFVKSGSGSLTLTADEALSHTGTTEVTQGTLIGSTAAFNDHDITTAINSRVELDQDSDGIYSGVISGDGSLRKSGTGVVTLDDANTYLGSTTILEGTLKLGSHGSLSSNTGLNISPDAVFDLNGQTQAIRSLTGSGSVLLGSGELTNNNAITNTYSGVISGTGSLVKTGSGIFNLTGTNTYSGGTSISDGQVNITSNANLGDASGGLSFNGGTLGVNAMGLTMGRDIFLDTNGGTLDLANNSVLLHNGVISGNGDLTITGQGYTILLGENTYTGNTNVENGNVAIESDVNLGATTSELNLTQGTLIQGGSVTSNRTVNVMSQGTIDTNGFDGTFSGPLTGYGLFVKTGSGKLNLTGDSTFTGDTEIHEGNLAMNGTWAGGMLVNGGTLSGAGTVAGNVLNEGVVAPGNSIDTLTINQNYSQGANGRLDIEIAPGAEHTDVLNVLGEVHLDGELNVTGQGLTGFSIGDRYTFLYGSGGINGIFGSVTDDLAFLDVLLDYSNPYAVSFLLANSATFASAASTPNQFQVGTALDNAAPGATGDFATLLTQLTLLTTPEAQAAYNNLSGEIYASNSAASIEQAQSLLRNMAERLRQGGGGDGSLLAVRMQTPDQAFQMVSTGDFNRQDDIIRLAHSQTVGDQTSSQVMPQSVVQFLQPVSLAQTWDGWIEGYGQSGRIGSNGNASGIGYSFGATNFGVGYYLDEVTTVGVLGGYANSTVRGGGSGLDRSEVETGQVGVYGRTSIDHNYLLGVINYGYQNYDTNRIVNVGGVTNTATGDYDAGQIGVLLEAGQNRSLGNFVVQPLVGLQYINLHTGSFTETATGGVGLNVDGQSDNSLRGSVGGRFLRPMTLRGGRTFVPEMQARYMYEFLDSSQSIGATFAGAAPGAPFAIQGVSAGNSFIVYGAGGSLVLNDSFSLYGHYIGQASDRLTSHTGTGGFQFSW